MPITEAEADPGAALIETPRLRLRPPAPEDAPAIAPLCNDWDVVRYTARLPYPYAQADAETWIANCAEGRAAGSELPLVVLLTDGTLIGAVGLIFGDDPAATSAEIGYWLGRPFWGHGYMSEAVRALLIHAFDDLGKTRICASVTPENKPSRRLAERLGFHLVERRTEPAPARGRDNLVDVFYLDREGLVRDG